MPLPAIVGIGWLASLLASLLGGLISFFAQRLTRRIANIAAMVVALGALTTAFWAACEALIAGIGLVTPEFLSQGIGMVVPSNAPVCFAAIASAHVLKWVYDWQVKIMLGTEGGAGS